MRLRSSSFDPFPLASLAFEQQRLIMSAWQTIWWRTADALPARAVAEEGAFQVSGDLPFDIVDPVIVFLVQVLETAMAAGRFVGPSADPRRG